MNPLDLLHNYRYFKAINRYSYPFLFFAIGAIKNLFQFTALAIGGWVIFQLGAPPQLSPSVDERIIHESVAIAVAPQQFADNEAVEVLAVAGDKAPQVNTVIKSNLHHTTPTTEKGTNRVVSWEWIMKQDENKFTIQFGSSPDKELLYETANSFPGNGAVVVFPFKKTPTNRTVYGFSTGLYDSLDSALVAIDDLPQNARSFGPWIRPISKLQQEIVVTLAK